MHPFNPEFELKYLLKSTVFITYILSQIGNILTYAYLCC